MNFNQSNPQMPFEKGMSTNQSPGQIPVSLDHLMKFLGDLYYKNKMYEEVITSQNREMIELRKQMEELRQQLGGKPKEPSVKPISNEN